MSRQRAKAGTNIYLPDALKNPAKEAAKIRYNLSLSGLITALLEREVSLKRGLLKKA